MRVVVVGGGHNGLVCAAYLARAGARVTLLERRPVLGGACVTEERWPGCRVSRAAYVLSLFRPRIVRDLELERHGLRLLPRRPSSFTPLPDGRSLVLGGSAADDRAEIARFSTRDADAYADYERWLARVAEAIEPTLDLPPPEIQPRSLRDLRALGAAARVAWKLRSDLPRTAQLMLGAARDLIEEWFESEPLRATLATDAVIGAFAAPSSPGTGYVLFHHVMGSLGGARGVWAYVQGGMGALSDALACAARAAGATLRTGAAVARLEVRAGGAPRVVLEDGETLECDVVVSNADPAHTFGLLDDPSILPDRFRRALGRIDYRSPVVKLNLLLDALPRFRTTDRDAPPLSGTVHVGALDLDALDRAFDDAAAGRVSARPMVELTVPSAVDPTLAPDGRFVASVFAQYAPARPPDDAAWPDLRSEMQTRVLGALDEVAPGFSASVREIEVLAAPDLEHEFGLRGGNIFHGAMTPDRLLLLRPLAGWARYATPVPGLYLCGSATHPGGGVMGAPGRNAALEILSRAPARRAVP